MSCLKDSPSSRGGVLVLDMSLRPSCLQLRDISCWRWITWTFLFEDFQCLLVRGLTGQGAETLWTTVGVLLRVLCLTSLCRCVNFRSRWRPKKMMNLDCTSRLLHGRAADIAHEPRCWLQRTSWPSLSAFPLFCCFVSAAWFSFKALDHWT